MNGLCSGKMRSTPSLLTMRRTVNVSLIPRPFFMITAPLKTLMRAFSPSVLRVATSTVSPTWNCGTSVFRYGCSTVCISRLIMASSPISSVVTSSAASRLALRSPLVRLPHVGPTRPRANFPLLQPPLRDGGVVAAEEHVRHAHAPEFAGPRVLRVLDQPVRERLVGRPVFGPEGPGQQTHDGVDHDHRRQLAAAEHVIADAHFARPKALDDPLVEPFVMPRDEQQSITPGEVLRHRLIEPASLRG